MRFKTAMVTLAMLFSQAPVAAVTTTTTYNFSANSFRALNGNTPIPPFATISGAFTVTFDYNTTLSSYDNVAGISLDWLDIPFGSAPSFDYSGGTLMISGLMTSSSSILTGSDDLLLILLGVNTAHPTFGVALYSTTLVSNDVYITGLGCVNGACITAADVPEPESWMMMIAGFGLVGATLRRRISTTAIA